LNSYFVISSQLPKRKIIKISICVFTVDVGEAREIKRELFELSGLPEKPGQNSSG
jgi:hypothetical protein